MLDTSMSAVADDDERARGARIGRRAAYRLLARRADDGLNGSPLPVPAPGPGVWSPLPPNLVGMSSWLGLGPAVLRCAHPTSSGRRHRRSRHSRRWTRDYEEVRAVGGTASTTGRRSRPRRPRAPVRPSVRPEPEGAARLLRPCPGSAPWPPLGSSPWLTRPAADGLIARFDAKYHYAFWCPVEAAPCRGHGREPGEPSPSRRGHRCWPSRRTTRSTRAPTRAPAPPWPGW